jgi:YVTN family beta-propeller protein
MRQVITEVAVGDRPYGILVDPGADRLYIAEQGIDRVTILDAATFQSISRVAVADRPSGLALSNDGRTLLVTHLLTGTITVVTVQPYQVFLPIILRSGIVGQGTVRSQPAAFQFLTFNISLWPDTTCCNQSSSRRSIMAMVCCSRCSGPRATS